MVPSGRLFSNEIDRADAATKYLASEPRYLFLQILQVSAGEGGRSGFVAIMLY